MSCIFCFAEMPHEITEGCDEYESDTGRMDETDSHAREYSDESSRPVLFRDGSERLESSDERLGDFPDISPKRPVGRPPKESGDEMSDVLSTGRKRAKAAAPISTGMVCEWARLEKAGGGVEPIIGCPNNPAADVHHGPDKSVLNNEVGVNLHRICKHCHHRWHAANDKYYDEPRPENGETWLPNLEWSPHDPSGKRMTYAAALMFEATRQQEDRRGK